MKAVILAGGYGSRMGDLCKSVPKPLVEINSKPILQHQIETLRKQGVSDFLIVTGYLAQSIEEYFGNGDSLGVNISYYRESEPLGTAGALFKINMQEDFLLCNGDLIFDIDLKSMTDFHSSNNALATLFVHPNNHPHDSVTLETDENSRVLRIYQKNEKAEFFQNLCNAGLQIVSPELLAIYDYKGKADFDRDVIMPAVKTGRIFAYSSSEYVHDAGTPERLKKSAEDLSSGLVASKSKRNKQKAVFVDRDGTLNIHKGYITNPYDIELTDSAAEAINILHSLGYIVIMITNQPVIARGECTTENLKKIHCRLEMLLAEEKAFLDGIYYCPHHPDKGFDGEIKELKIVCSCRKPAPGLILQAGQDFNVDMKKSFMVGDSLTDIEAGLNAGCTPIYIGSKEIKDISTFDSLKAFADHLSADLI